MTITRRGFLSLVAGLSAMSVLPAEAEPIVQSIKPLVFPNRNIRVMRYSMGLMPESMEPILPGRVTILRGLPPIVMRPDRMVMNSAGFNLLHLGTHGNPILEGEIDSDLFMANGYGQRLELDTIKPGQEIIIAAVNRNPEPKMLVASLMGSACYEITAEEYEAEQKMLKDDEKNYINKYDNERDEDEDEE